MMNCKLIYLVLVSSSTSALAGCGVTDAPTVDRTKMGDGTSNKTSLGGCWWTHVDRSGLSAVDPDTSKVDAANTTKLPPELNPPIDVGRGLEDGAYHAVGVVGTAPNYQRNDVFDPYWDGLYGKNAPSRYSPGVCGTYFAGGEDPKTKLDLVPSSCGEMKYPSVGLGFGFKAHNAPLGKDAEGLVGVSFKLKLGPTDESTSEKGLNVALPMDYTDVPDPTFGDRFGTQFTNPVLRQTGIPVNETRNTPICTFPGTILTDSEGEAKLDKDGKPELMGSSAKTCFMNMTTQGHFGSLSPKDRPLSKTEYHTYCLRWSDFGKPEYGDLDNATPPVKDFETEPGNVAHIIKMQFDAYKPSETEPPAQFDLFVDDVYLLDQAKWDELCTGDDVIKTNQPS